MLFLKVGRLSSDGIFLFLGLFTLLQVNDVAFAAKEMRSSTCEIVSGQNAIRAEQYVETDTHIISGELISTDNDYYFIRDESGKEVSLLSDKRTVKGIIEKGDRITAYVDDDKYALWIRSNENTDRRSEHASLDCNPN
jgi:hypothetical protein